jgi:hypothetical protein
MITTPSIRVPTYKANASNIYGKRVVPWMEKIREWLLRGKWITLFACLHPFQHL